MSSIDITPSSKSSGASLPKGLGLPQHLMNDKRSSSFGNMNIARAPCRQKSRFPCNKLSWTGVALAISPMCLSHRSAALTVTSPRSPGARSLVDQALKIREMRRLGRESQLSDANFYSDVALDNDAWVAALFSDSSQPAPIMGQVSDCSWQDTDVMKKRAEELDRLAEEDANVASIVKANVKPGSLVDNVQNAKGADVDAELLLQAEARIRRARITETTSLESISEKPAMATMSSISTKKAITSPKIPRKSTSLAQPRSDLLTREQEYELARTIQRGVQVHKIKSEFEAKHSRPPSKREWASLANCESPNELRRVVSEYRRAKSELVTSNMGLVHAVAKNYRRKALSRGISAEELIQEGSLGLLRAAELFDPEKGLRFSTYATIWIKGTLSNTSLSEVIALPAREKTKWNKIQMALNDIEKEEYASHIEASSHKKSSKGGRTQQLSAQLGMKQSEVEYTLRKMKCAQNVLSLDYQYDSVTRSGHTDGGSYDAFTFDSKLAVDADLAERTQFRADVIAALVSNLNEREAQLMRLRYGLLDGKERTLKECAEEMGLNRETTRLLANACLKKLRTASDAQSLQEYLLTVA